VIGPLKRTITESIQRPQQKGNHATDRFEPALPASMRHYNVVVPCTYVTCRNMPYKSCLP